MLKEMRVTQKIFPDSFTFGSMFLLYRTIRPRAVRTHHRNGTSPLSPRALYRDFMLAVKPKGRTERIARSTALMNVILRAFIRQRDYAGAFIVLSSSMSLYTTGPVIASSSMSCVASGSK